MEELFKLYAEILAAKSLIKIVFSRPRAAEKLKTTGRIVSIKNVRTLQTETFMKDGKALHENIPENTAQSKLEELSGEYRQINIFTSGGNCEALISKSGSVHLKNAINAPMTSVKATENDRAHRFILDPEKAAPFLSKLGVTDEEGVIFDRKRSKFRQINRFTEILDDVYKYLPAEGELTVLDLCCGKSYLTFAVYYYLTELKSRSVRICGVDLKSDVIDFCRKTAEELGFDGMIFYCQNIFDFIPPAKPDLVVSLHACDIATDMVLYNAVRMDARVILSTPCCHHEMMNQLSGEALSFVSQSMYRQKLCDAFTDSLRCKRLEVEGYKVTALELIDPEETPKNVLIKAIKSNVSEEKRKKALAEYKSACNFLGVQPYLEKLFEGRNENEWNGK